MFLLSRLTALRALTASSRCALRAASSPCAGFSSLPPPPPPTRSQSQWQSLLLLRRLSTTTSASSRVSAHDAKLSSLLDSELAYEKSAAAEQSRQQPQRQQPPPPHGFTVTRLEGTQVTLARKCPDDGSLLEVTFDLNGSAASPQADEGEGGDEPEGGEGFERPKADGGAAGEEEAEAEAIQSRPDLTIRVRKPGCPACLAVRCSFPPAHVSRQMAAEDPDYPSLSIDTVAVEGGAADQLGAYELEADMLNDELYKQLAEMLVHRGVTRQFEDSLVEFCTGQEHGLYLRFLAEAKKFCDA